MIQARQNRNPLARQNAKRWQRQAFEAAQHRVQAHVKHLLHGRSTQDALMVPLDIEVVLVGFAGDGAYGVTLDRDALQALLSATLREHCPTLLSSREAMQVCYGATFNVHHSRVDLGPLEDTIRLAMEPQGTVHVPAYDSRSERERELTLYGVEATLVEPALEDLLDEHYAIQALNPAQGGADEPVGAGTTVGAEATGGVLPRSWRDDNLIVVMNPNKERLGMKGGVAEGAVLASTNFEARWDAETATADDLDSLDGSLRYMWNYEGGGQSATWLAAAGYLVIDLSAGPCSYGPEVSPSGSVTPLTLPSLPDLFTRTRSAAVVMRGARGRGAGPDAASVASTALRGTLLRGALAALVSGAAQHAFMADVAHVSVPHQQRVLLPVLVLRNHQAFNPLEPGLPWSLELSDVSDFAEGIAEADQEVVVVSGLHQLSQHPAIDVALQSSIFSRSEAVLPEPGIVGARAPSGLHSRVSHYVDGDVLLDNLANSADMLVASVLEPESLLARELYEDGTLNVRTQEGQLGTHIVPVFVLSLTRMPPGLQFLGGGLVYSTSRGAVVLQMRDFGTEGSEGSQDARVQSGHESEGRTVYYDSLDATRHVIAGFAASYSGLVPPYQRYEALTGKLENNWLWATGSQPFGPYSNSTTAAKSLQRMSKRNLLLSRVHGSVVRLRTTLLDLDAYLMQHVGLPFGDKLGADALLNYAGGSLLDLLLQRAKARAVSDLPPAMIDQTSQLVEVIEEKINALTRGFFDNLTGHEQAQQARVLEYVVGVLERFLQPDPDETMTKLGQGRTCCRIVLPNDTTAYTLLSVCTGIILSVAAGIYLA